MTIKRLVPSGRRRPLPTLSDLDLDNIDDYEIMQSGSRNAAAGLPVHGHGTGEGLEVTGCPGCWCGQRYGHDWPGKAEGQAHPR